MAKRLKSKRKRSTMSPARRAVRDARNREAYERASQCSSQRNMMLVVAALTARGIPESEIEPGVNVLTVPAWNHLGRRVIAGQQGTPIPVFRKSKKTDPKTGAEEEKAFWGTSRVFHISQTVEFGEPNPETEPAIGPASDAEPAIERFKAEYQAKRAMASKAGVLRMIDQACDSSGIVLGDDLHNYELGHGEQDYAFSTAADRLPSEIVEALQGQPPCVRAMFTTNTPRGGLEDAMGQIGVDRLVSMARDMSMTGAQGKVEALKSSGANDPRASMAVVLYELRQGTPASQLPRLEPIDESRMTEGAYFEIAGQGFAVFERGGTLWAGSGGAHSFSIDCVGAVPVDAGTFDPDARVSPGSVRGEIPF